MKVDDLDKFIKEAENLDFIKNIVTVNSEIKMMVERGENLVATLVNFANKNNIMVNSIELEHPNLEDVFINYTGKRISEGVR
jgi:ABC-2 type transport system ATP-binding protein